jgi:galactokinase
VVDDEALRREVAARHDVPLAEVGVVRSPYRVCPLGAHIDHQLGPVTAMAVDRRVSLAFAPSPGRSVRVTSLDFPGEVRFEVDDVPDAVPGDWGNFPRGAARVLGLRQRLDRGLVGTISGRLHGGGISSSAAVGAAFLLAFERANGLDVSPEENIELGRMLENDYVGLRCGALDQAAVLLSRRGHLTSFDCRTGEHELVPAAPGAGPFRIALAFSGLRRALVGTDYNRRVDECVEAARVLLSAAGRVNGAPVLGHVRPDEYEAHRGRLDARLARRAEHYFGEVDRVRRGVTTWRAGDLPGLGALMTASGESSIRNYECGSPPMIDLYETLVATEGVHGARFSGAGFRGCCVALVTPEAAEGAVQEAVRRYASRHPHLAEGASVIVCDTADGARVLTDSGLEPT